VRQNNSGVEDVRLLATGYQLQLYPHTPALGDIYKPLHGKTSGSNCVVPFQMSVQGKGVGGKGNTAVEGLVRFKATQSVLLISCIASGYNSLLIKDREKRRFVKEL